MRPIWPSEMAAIPAQANPFAKAQPGLSGFAKPELHSKRPNGDGIAIAQDGLVNGLAVDGSQGVGLSTQDDALGGVEVELQMLFPNAVFLQLQVGVNGASDAYRKTAGYPCGARLFPGQNLKLDHYQSRRGTWILSPT